MVSAQAVLPVFRTSWGAEPAGWTNNQGAQLLDPFACSGDDAAAFNQMGASRTVFFNGPAIQLVMKLKKDGSMGLSELKVEQSPDNVSWSTLGVYEGQSGTPIVDCADITLALFSTTRYIRWTFLKASGNCDMDDVRITAVPVSIWTNPITDADPSAADPYTAGQTFDPNITVSGIGRGTGISANAGSDRYNAKGWSTAALIANDYFYFTLTPNAGYKIDFSSFTYTGQVSSGSPSFALRSSIDGYTANIGTPNISGTTISLSAATYQGITAPVTFRFYAYNLAAAATTYSIDDFTFSGIVAPASTNTITTGAVTGAPFTLAACNATAPGTVAFTSAGTFTSNTYTAQLSDAAGSFAAPLTVGTLTSDANNGIISISIPAVPSGTGYKIKIISNSPLVFGSMSAAFAITSPSCISNATDHFRSNITTGNWSAAASWESSPTGGAPWIPATVAPTSASASINIQAGHTIQVSSTVSLDQATVSGVLEIQNNGTLSINDGSGDDITIANGGILRTLGARGYTLEVTYNASANIHVQTGGKITIGTGASILGGSFQGFTTNANNIWDDAAVYEWNTTNAFAVSGVTYFLASSANIPVFRVKGIIGGAVGGASSFIVNGLFEINENLTFTGTGGKTFRNGIRGTAILTQNAGSGGFSLSAPGAILDGPSLRLAISSNLQLGANTFVPANAFVTVSGANILNVSGILTVNGTLDVTTIQLNNAGVSTAVVNGTFRTAHAGGFSGTGSSIPGGAVTVNNSGSPASTVEYYAAGNQVVSSRNDYYNIVLSGSGNKTPASGFDPAGTVTITGNAVFDCTGYNVGAAATNLTMDGGRLIVSTTGTQPGMGGTYNLTGGTVQFDGNNATAETVRNKTYQNIEVTGNNVGNSLGNITLNPLGTFTVKPGGIFEINANAITGPIGTQTLTVAAGGTFKCGDANGFNELPAGVLASVRGNIENIVLAANSTVEYSKNGDQVITNANGLVYHHLSLSGSGTKTAPAGNLVLTGTLVKSGTPVFDHNNGTVSFNGSSVQNYISNTPGIKFYDLVNNNINGLNLGSTLSIAHKLSLAAGSVTNVNGIITLLSDNANTAQVDVIPASAVLNYGAGKFIVERYIPNHSKAWQLLSVPTTTGQSVHDAWQEGNAPASNTINPGYGTTITSNIAGNGFDLFSSGGPSMKTYEPVGNTWDGIPNTAIPIYNQKGYMLFVRGDRSVMSATAPATATVLRTAGRIYSPTDPPPSTTVLSRKFESVGNPYASAIDFNTVFQNSPAIGDIQNIFYVWDPKLTTTTVMGGPSQYGLGAYQTFTYNISTGEYDVTPGGGSYAGANRKIESGQAFLIRSYPLGNAGGTISFGENCKVSGSSVVTRTMGLLNSLQQLRTSLEVMGNGGAVPVDGVLSQFDPAFSSSIDPLDAFKIGNTGENVSILRNGYYLTAESRDEIHLTDTIYYSLGQLRLQAYRFKLAPENMPDGFEAFLVDTYLDKRTAVSLRDESFVNFTVTADPASAAPKRFYLVFQKTRPPITIFKLKGDRHGGEITVSWKVADEAGVAKYEVERSMDGIVYETAAYKTPYNNNGATSTYAQGDQQLPYVAVYYRIKAVLSSGDIKYSNSIYMQAIEQAPSIVIVPNPVVNKRLNLQFTNQPAGNYRIELINNIGQVVYRNTVAVNGYLVVNQLVVSNVPAGAYNLSIVTPGGERNVQAVIIK
jgi:hypothetical protein